MSKKLELENETINQHEGTVSREPTVSVIPDVEKSDVALREEVILNFWLEHEIFKKSIDSPAGGEPVGDFVFYDGPPFATGTPHYGHLLAGTIKDAIPRFWTMNGYRVRRTWGWDCHGLPLENLIEKKLGLANKRDIEAFGIKNFNEAARNAVMEFADVWKMVVPRMGRFVDMDDDYKTMDSTYTESVWWVFKQLHEKGLVYEGFKSMHLCPRCGTTLSNFEVNLGYKDIKDIAVFVALPLSEPLLEAHEPKTSLVVWTTTPWTLPGNMAAAVHQDFTYAVVETKDDSGKQVERFVVAKERVRAVFGVDGQYEVVSEMSGADLVGRSYQPPFPYLQEQEIDGKEHAWKIYHAQYVELGEQGTGAVHLAPAYGEEDMQLAQQHGVPIFHHVDYEGRFKEFVTDFAGQLVKPKDDDTAGVSHLDADIEVVKALKERGVLLKKENITHSYPHCWRDDTPLLNYATTSWFVKVSTMRDELVAVNDAVHWVPEHVGKNRFGRWLQNARDWAVSRQRYWGAPLPIWKNPQTGTYKVFGSLSELKDYVPNRKNTFTIMRHAEAESNLTGVINSLPTNSNPLTEKGRTQCTEAGALLVSRNIDLIIHSGMQRTRETAELIASALGLASDAILIDERITELKAGTELEGKTWNEYNALYENEAEKFTRIIPGVENRHDVQRRVGEFLYDINNQYEGKHILIIGHASSLFALQVVAEGAHLQRAIEIKQQGFVGNAEVHDVAFFPLPHNDVFELDFHRPYIDEIDLYEEGVRLERVPDVFDCWFESGAMPYGQHHYPFKVEDTFLIKHFPAQFIAESVDQTRGWFYSLMVLGVALFGKSPYENVITNGLVLAEDGKKMSKSLQNYPDPMELAGRVGADSMRYYLLSAPIMRGEDLNFSEKEVLELQRKNIGRLHNVLALYELYADGTQSSADSDQVLDRWIIARLAQLISESTEGYRSYEIDRATRPISDFIDDLSVWYVRRSRDRLKSADREDKKSAVATLRFVLRELAKIMAPAMPFYAEHLWQRVRTEAEAESVHLVAWPSSPSVKETVIPLMQEIREIISEALLLRTKANVKVRQPLAALYVAEGVTVPEEFHVLIAEELNVKKIVTNCDFVQNLGTKVLVGQKVALDTEISDGLKAEGEVREFIRAVQQGRKEMDLKPAESIILLVSEPLMVLVSPFISEVQQVVGAQSVDVLPAESSTVVPKSVPTLAPKYVFAIKVV